ncbi:DUF1289 domain-containing protein [Salinivibrio kushneri]|uniref:DUF1289 domain-containing protein n=1 Tax=Salinivibrio kushneri TaxID=1908198 RepID=A0AB36K1R5_9GAMM|nr:DUF1289 domain-containing protein [Salinivibrio kushneri]OOE34192.1 DUF1289 domain-containing protein [Salinivibrio kushneri]OOE41882.1 DUF1289 domain-containing protein [Salinivibrio kushneri]OOE41947.1 DUF1289 domain-containing protein [Salinivibrio kushneri]OOE51204.1 DUF1289 domain-containing protein [Salinivibrio kushneri]OOE52495.1 DUF1289 domain-containing protein [Salinivibrio kushneri]
MEQLDFFEVPSPCKGICQVNNKGYCKGCFRSRDERFYWYDFTNEQKRNVVRLCHQRYLRILRAKRKQALDAALGAEPLPYQPSLFDEPNDDLSS